jgi:REP element-mobilizing transposase RayT
MPLIIPDDRERFTTPGEEVFCRFLSTVAKPDDRYIVWYSPDISDSEPDFILYSEKSVEPLASLLGLNMPYNPDIHHRRSIRLKEYNYSSAGAYFVTVCARQRECLFGEIVDGKMVLNDVGRIVADEWESIEKTRDYVVLDEFSVMPNHFHGIIFLSDNVGAIPTGRPCWRWQQWRISQQKSGEPPASPLPVRYLVQSGR